MSAMAMPIKGKCKEKMSGDEEQVESLQQLVSLQSKGNSTKSCCSRQFFHRLAGKVPSKQSSQHNVGISEPNHVSGINSLGKKTMIYFVCKMKTHVCGINSLGIKRLLWLQREVSSHAEMLHQIQVISVKLNSTGDISKAS